MPAAHPHRRLLRRLHALFLRSRDGAYCPNGTARSSAAYFFISSLYLAIVFWTLLVVLQPRLPVEVRHDLGKLVLAFSILTTSLLYMQLLTIWYENFPDETSYLIQRMHCDDWKIVSSIIVLSCISARWSCC